MFLTHFNAILTLTTLTHNLGFKCVGGSIHMCCWHILGVLSIWNLECITIWNLWFVFCVLICFCKFGNTFWNAFGILEFGIKKKKDFGILPIWNFGIWNPKKGFWNLANLEFGIIIAIGVCRFIIFWNNIISIFRDMTSYFGSNPCPPP